MSDKKAIIIAHSKTGNTYSVAERLSKALEESGVIAHIERIMPEDEDAYIRKIHNETPLDVGKYDAIIFGAPVRAFSLSPVMAAYLRQSQSLVGKKVLCYATQSLPYPWMGGNRAIAGMTKICKSKGAKVCRTGIINWNRKDRAERIQELSEAFASEIS